MILLSKKKWIYAVIFFVSSLNLAFNSDKLPFDYPEQPQARSYKKNASKKNISINKDSDSNVKQKFKTKRLPVKKRKVKFNDPPEPDFSNEDVTKKEPESPLIETTTLSSTPDEKSTYPSEISTEDAESELINLDDVSKTRIVPFSPDLPEILVPAPQKPSNICPKCPPVNLKCPIANPSLSLTKQQSVEDSAITPLSMEILWGYKDSNFSIYDINYQTTSSFKQKFTRYLGFKMNYKINLKWDISYLYSEYNDDFSSSTVNSSITNPSASRYVSYFDILYELNKKIQIQTSIIRKNRILISSSSTISNIIFDRTQIDYGALGLSYHIYKKPKIKVVIGAEYAQSVPVKSALYEIKSGYEARLSSRLNWEISSIKSILSFEADYGVSTYNTNYFTHNEKETTLQISIQK